MDVEIIGISPDDVETHRRFKMAHNLPFELLADEQGKVTKLYKASLPLIRFTRRVTYLLDQSHVIVAVYDNLFAAENHIRAMVDKVKAGALR